MCYVPGVSTGTASTADAPTAVLARPLPFRARADVTATPVRLGRGGGVDWVLKDPVALTYHRLSDRQHALWRALDGRTGPTDLCERLGRLFPDWVPRPADLSGPLSDLHRKHLIVGERPGLAPVLVGRAAVVRNRRRLAAWRNPFYVRGPGFDPTRLLDRLEPFGRLLFSRPGLVAGLTLAASALSVLVARPETLVGELEASAAAAFDPSSDAGVGFWTLWLTVGAVKVVHEFGHALAARRFGAECPSIGVAFLLFSPCLYCDVSDSWRLPSRAARMLIAGAGMLVELLLAALAVWVWHLTRPGPLHDLALTVAAVASVGTVLFNLNPLLRYDGYHLLADAAGVPNLRTRANAALGRLARRTLLGVTSNPSDDGADGDEPAPLAAAGLAGFAVASFAYRLTITVAIAGLVRYWAEPLGLAPLALLAAAVLLAPTAHAFWKGLRMTAADLRATFDDPRFSTRPSGGGGADRTRAAGLAVLAGTLLFAACTVPLPRSDAAAGTFEPADLRPVYAGTDATVAEVVAPPGTRVAAGDVLFRLEDPRAASRRNGAAVRLAAHRTDAALQAALGDAAAKSLADGAVRTAGVRLAALDRRAARLTVRAPAAGTVTASANFSADDPLEPGRRVEADEPLARIAAGDGWRVVAAVPPALRAELTAGRPARVRPSAWPGTELAGTVESIAPRDDANEQDAVTDAVLVTVRVPGPAPPLRTGMAASVRFPLPPRTLWDRGVRAFRGVLRTGSS